MYKILIVDDENFIRRGLAGCLDWESLGCKLIGTAANGSEALEIVKNNKPDIIISDINMDKMSGLELVEHVSYQQPDIKCILFTGIYEFNNVYSAIKFDVVDLILKPTSPARIQQALSKAIYQIENERTQFGLKEQIKQQTRQNLQLKQAMLLSNIVEGSTDYGDSIEEALSNVEVNLENYVFITLLLYGVQDDNENLSSAFFKAEGTVYSYIDPLFEDTEYYCAFSNGQSIHVLVNFKEVKDNTLTETKKICIDLEKTIDNLTEFYCTIGISEFHTNPNEIQRAASESLNAANFASYDNRVAAIALFSELPQMESDTMSDIKSYIDRFYNAINSTSDDELHVIMTQLLDYCEDNKLSLDETRNISILLANICACNLWEVGEGDKSASSVQQEYGKRLHDCLRLNEIKKNLNSILQQTLNNKTKPDRTSHNIVDRVEKYIKKNYKEELSLDKIAGEFHISSSYLSRMFKSKKGLSLTTYIQTVRIEKAKGLIETSDLRTYEIADEVGITDPVYFSKIFKKFTGMRVRDYREQFLKKEN